VRAVPDHRIRAGVDHRTRPTSQIAPRLPAEGLGRLRHALSPHSFGAAMVNSFRAAYFRHSFLFDKRLNRTSPRELGFNYDTTLDAAQGPPFFIVNGYASIGDPITGPRDTVQNTFEFYDGLSRVPARTA